MSNFYKIGGNMCVAIPGVITQINDNNTATVDFNGNLVNAATGLVDVSIGDNVLVHAGCIIQKVSKSEAEEILDIFKEIEELS